MKGWQSYCRKSCNGLCWESYDVSKVAAKTVKVFAKLLAITVRTFLRSS
jgi:hypothetical protein